MKITSQAFKEGESIPSKYTCEGENINPPLTIQDIPKEAKSLALIMEDPDVPRYLREDQLWVHWVVFNIPPTLSSISENKEPEGIHGLGTGKKLKYEGPCPPDREHRYFFRIYALDIMLNLKEGATKDQVETAIKGHVLAQAELMGVYEKRE